MFRVYFSLFLFTLLFFLVGCFLSWESSFARLPLEIIRSAKVEMALEVLISKNALETAAFGGRKLN